MVQNLKQANEVLDEGRDTRTKSRCEEIMGKNFTNIKKKKRNFINMMKVTT